MNLKCKCGSENFKACHVTIELYGLPCNIHKEYGPQYDDLEADQSNGWDWVCENEVRCPRCQKTYEIIITAKGDISLRRINK